jgi:hypothetical protein
MKIQASTIFALKRGNLCFNDCMTKEKKPNSPQNTALEVAKNALGVTTALAIIIISYGFWLEISSRIQWKSGMEYMFMFYAPFMLAACAFLFIRGVILLVRAVRRKTARKAFRVALATISIIYMLPGSYILYGLGEVLYLQFNSSYVRSDTEIAAMIKDCKVSDIIREYTTPHMPDENKLAAKVYLNDSAKSAKEKETYFYSYRSFSPSHYENLADLALSDGVKPKCGRIALHDDANGNASVNYDWVDEEMARNLINGCHIRDIITIAAPDKKLLAQAPDNQDTSTRSMFAIWGTNFAGKLYIKDADARTQSIILALAKLEYASCNHKKLNIDESE